MIATALGSIGIVLTLFYSAYSFTTTLREGYYAELDRVYFELLKIGLERPYLRAPHAADRPRQGQRVRRVRLHGVELPRDGRRPLRAPASPEPARDVVPRRRDRERASPRLVRRAGESRKFKERFCRFIDERYPVGVLAQRGVASQGPLVF